MGLTGCSANQKNNVNDDTVKRNFNATSTNNQNRAILNDTNQKLRISTRASKSVERMEEVDQAHVIVRNNNAYVAVRLKNNGTGTTGTNGTRGNGTNTGTTNTGTNGSNSQMYGNGFNSGATGTTGMDGNKNHAGTSGMGGTGINNSSTGRSDAGVNNNGTTGIGNNNNTTGINGTGGSGANGAAGNGTTGLGGNNYSEVSSPLEQKIADQVRAADTKIHKVYVSVNPDFFNQMTTYSSNIGNGKNRGLLNDFSNTVRRFFR